jgi:hypothetical protein
MTSVRVRTSVTGAALAVVAGALVVHGAVFGADFLPTVVLGLAVGAALGLVQHRSAPERAVAFVLGVLAAWVGYALRAGVLPDIPMGRGLAVVVVISLITAVAAASAERLPMWAGLLGAAVLAGAYEVVYTASPSDFTAESTIAVTSVLLAAAFGFVVGATVPTAVATATASGPRRGPREDAVADDDGSTTSLDKLMNVPSPRNNPRDASASTTNTESER